VLAAAPGIVARPGDPVAAAVERLTAGEAGAIYTRRMEYGPRALGARTILATPADATINDTLNQRLERSEFMPFAPVVAEEDADTVFKLGRAKAYAARFMTITAHVQPGWQERIPAVVHGDGTARPQVIRRAWNPLYYDILKAFERRTGLPILINTSFNVHEEPIINRPEECLSALADGRIDYVATENAVYAGPAARRAPGAARTGAPQGAGSAAI
jgi:carbamoyltransferase